MLGAELLPLELRLRRTSTAAYAVGVALYTVVVVALYPSFKGATNLDQTLAKQPGLSALFGINGSITTPDGWLAANLYANFLPLILLLLTIGYGASALAGEEDRRRLDLVLALPLARRRLVVEKAVAMTLIATVVSVLAFAAALLGRAFQIDVSVTALVETTLAVLLLALALGLGALALGALTGERGHAIGIAAAAGSAMYLLGSLAALVGWLGGARKLSLFYWAVENGQLAHGVSWAGFAILAAAVLVMLLAAIAAFERHDVAA
jgi:beta-exotoxin I transport system permease protein